MQETEVADTLARGEKAPKSRKKKGRNNGTIKLKKREKRNEDGEATNKGNAGAGGFNETEKVAKE